MAENTETETGTETGTENEPTRTDVESGDIARLTQADVDRIVESRLARDRKKTAEELETLRSKAAKLDEIEEANKSELEKAQAAEAAARQRAEEIENNSKEIVARSSLLQEIAKPDHKIVDPEGAVEFLLGVDRDLVTFGEDGVPTNVGEALEKLVEKRSYLVSSDAKPATDADQGPRGGSRPDQLTEADLKSMTPHEIVKAREDGRLIELMGGK